MAFIRCLCHVSTCVSSTWACSRWNRYREQWILNIKRMVRLERLLNSTIQLDTRVSACSITCFKVIHLYIFYFVFFHVLFRYFILYIFLSSIHTSVLINITSTTSKWVYRKKKQKNKRVWFDRLFTDLENCRKVLRILLTFFFY